MRRKRLLWIGLALALYIHLFFVLLRVESGHERATIKTVGDAAWYVIVTLTTVGYGDTYPVTPLGRIIGAVFLLSSLGIIGLLIGMVSGWVREIQHKWNMGYYGTAMKNHVVIIGWDEFAHAVVDCLLAAKKQVAIVTHTKDTVEEIYERFSKDFVFVLHSGYDSIKNFEKVNISGAALVFVNVQGDTDKLITIINVRQSYPKTNLQFLVVLEQQGLRDTFIGAGVTYVLSKNDIAAKLVASYIFEPDVAHFNNDLLSHALSKNDYDVQEYKVLEHNPLVNKQYGEVFQSIKEQFGCLPIGLVKTRDRERLLLKIPPDKTPVQAGDYLIFILNGEQARHIEQYFAVKEGI